MKKNSNIAVGLSIRYYVSAIITFFIYFSVTVIATGIFTTNIGYTAYSASENNDTGKNELLYHYYYEEGEDTKKAEFEAKGIEVSTVPLRSTLSGTPKAVTDIVSQIAGALITFGFIHNALWNLGAGDSNLINFGHMEFDRLRGAKIGLMAAIPGFVAWLVAVVAKSGLIGGKWFGLFRFLNYQAFLPFNTIFGQSTATTDLVSWTQIFLGVLLLLILPVFAEIFYILGFKKISFTKIIYKKDK